MSEKPRAGQFAAFTGFAYQQTVQKIENGNRHLRADEMIKVSEAFDLDMSYWTDHQSPAAPAIIGAQLAADRALRTIRQLLNEHFQDSALAEGGDGS